VARVEKGEDPCWIFVLLVKPFGLVGFHTCPDASLLDNVALFHSDLHEPNATLVPG
jgi:hypothetical protein